MPRYFFDIRKSDHLDEDPEGEELPSDTAALEEAVLSARELLAAKVLNGQVVDGDQFEIRNETGAVVHVLPFRSVLKLD